MISARPLLLVITLATFLSAFGSTGTPFECDHYVVSRTAFVKTNEVPLFSYAEAFKKRDLPAARIPGGDYDVFLHSLHENAERASIHPEFSVLLNYTISNGGLSPFSFVLRGGSLRGGSSFTAQTETVVDGRSTLGPCAVHDSFDGSYRLHCAQPPQRGVANTRLTVELTHVEFGAFSPFGRGMRVMEQMKEPLFECALVVRDATRDTVQQRRASLLPFDVSGGWWEDARSAAPHHLSSDGVDWLRGGVAMLTACTSVKYSDVHMVGESHMRFFYDFLLQLLDIWNGALDVKHTDDAAGNIRYYARHYITRGPEGGVIIDALNEMIMNASLSSRSLLMVSFGSWHLHGMTLGESIDAARGVLLPKLGEIAGKGVRVVLISSPAQFKQIGGFDGIKNTHAASALFESLHNDIPANVEFLNLVPATRLFMESVRCEAFGMRRA